MKLKFIFLGKKGSESFDLIINKYLKRLNHYIKTESHFLNDKNKLKVEQSILSIIKTNDYFVVLDEQGRLYNTLEYTQFIEKHIRIYSSIVFLVGGAYGVSKTIKDKSNSLISLSKMTFPHLIARLMLVEQTYRSFTIFNNHPYHHE